MSSVWLSGTLLQLIMSGLADARGKSGSCTYCAFIVKVAFLSLFQFCFIIYTTYLKKKLHALTAKKKIHFFYNLHNLPQKKNTRIYRKKKIIRLDDFFVHNVHFSQGKLAAHRARGASFRHFCAPWNVAMLLCWRKGTTICCLLFHTWCTLYCRPLMFCPNTAQVYGYLGSLGPCR